MENWRTNIRQRVTIAVAATVLVVAGTGAGAAGEAQLSGVGESGQEIVTTQSQVSVNGRALKYTARAGFLPIRENETGEIHGNMFFMSYTLDRSPGEGVRPLTFLWNGGPGASSSLVHLLGFGPRVVRAGAPPIDNEGTWLDFTDLVFVDPIGTGYSRPTKAEYGAEFYQTRGDAESVAEFIRVYRTRFEAWDAPVFLAGESYGVVRAAHVAEVLHRRGIPVVGAVLIGLAPPIGKLSDDLRTALMVPTYTASAFANRKLAPELQRDLQATLRQSERWAETEYAPALARRDALTDAQRDKVLAGLSRFTGLKVAVLDRKTLTVEMPRFAEQLLRDENKVVGRYDTRMVGPRDTTQQMYDPTKDPSLADIIDSVSVVRYLRNELRFRSDLLYQGPFGGGYPPPTTFRGDWMSVKWIRPSAGAHEGAGTGAGGATSLPAGGSGPGSVLGEDLPLRRAMTANPRLNVLVACGYYDLVCAYAGNTRLVSELEPALRQNVAAKAYGGGHAIYTDEAAKREFKKDVASFVRSALGGPTGRH